MPTEKNGSGPASNKFFWIAVLYVAQGFPAGFINDTIPIIFRKSGVDLAKIGLLSLIGMAWTLKFLWSPAVDFIGKRKHWMVSCQVLLAACLFAFSFLAPGSVGSVTFLILAAMAVFSATQDIAIDAYTIELVEPSEMGRANGIRVGAYRAAMVLSFTLMVMLSASLSWPALERGAAGFMLVLAVFTLLSPATKYRREDVVDRRKEPIWEPVKKLLKRPSVLWVALFIVTFKLGDTAMAPMTKPFLVDRGMGAFEIGVLQGTLVLGATILGAFLGGQLTSRWGIFHGLWALGAFQALSNLGYVAAASWHGQALIWGAAVFEGFCGGLGTAAFLAFLMSCCEKKYAATQYAVLFALFGTGKSLSGAISGYGTEHMGYANYFLLTFLVAIPAFFLLPFVRKWIPGNDETRMTAYETADPAGSNDESMTKSE